jgi:hypothetical protein
MEKKELGRMPLKMALQDLDNYFNVREEYVVTEFTKYVKQAYRKGKEASKEGLEIALGVDSKVEEFLGEIQNTLEGKLETDQEKPTGKGFTVEIYAEAHRQGLTDEKMVKKYGVRPADVARAKRFYQDRLKRDKKMPQLTYYQLEKELGKGLTPSQARRRLKEIKPLLEKDFTFDSHQLGPWMAKYHRLQRKAKDSSKSKKRKKSRR